MSAARKAAPLALAPPAPAHGALVDAARQAHGKSCKAVTEAEGAVRTAKAALAAAPRDPRERAVAREALLMCEEDLETAKTGKASSEQRLQAAERARDEADALALGERLSRTAMNAQVDALTKVFEKQVIGGMRTFLLELFERRVSSMTDAQALQIIWSRLGNDFRLPNVEVERDTTTVPSSAGLTSIESSLRSRVTQQLSERARAKDQLGVAALRFLLLALAPEHGAHHSGPLLQKYVCEAVEQRKAKAGNSQ